VSLSLAGCLLFSSAVTVEAAASISIILPAAISSLSPVLPAIYGLSAKESHHYGLQHRYRNMLLMISFLLPCIEHLQTELHKLQTGQRLAGFDIKQAAVIQQRQTFRR